MANVNPFEMPAYELPLRPVETPAALRGAGDRALPERLLRDNARWFCRLRFVVIGFLASFGLAGQVPGLFEALGFVEPGAWPFAAAATLLVGNVAFLLHLRRLSDGEVARGIRKHLWGQIIFDLLVLTVVVHFLGCLQTNAPFAYLFHIVLACIFFSRGQSLGITFLAGALLAACFVVVHLGWSSPPGLWARPTPLPGHVGAVDFISVFTVWLVVWYMASRLSELVRQRDRDLAETNRHLSTALKERADHMLTTTHELKAPFAAIHANAQLLLHGYCGGLPEPAVETVHRIATRSQRLAAKIQEMLQLANLTSDSQLPSPSVSLDLSETMRWCIERIERSAEARGIRLEADIQQVWVLGVRDHLQMLLSNLLFNAVTYSHPNGRVQVRCGPDEHGTARVTIADEGIGIDHQKLPHVFDEYYRTREAAEHNPESSGLGLAIVRRIAELHRIRLLVFSQPGMGTMVELRFPAGQPLQPTRHRHHGGIDVSSRPTTSPHTAGV